MACWYGYLEVAQWLWSLDGFNKENIKENIQTHYKIVKDWIETL